MSKLTRGGLVALALSLTLGGTAFARGPAWHARRAAKRAEIMARFDANKDGTLDDGERKAAKAARRAEKLQRMKARFTATDTNKDGAVTWAEMEAAWAQRGAQRGKGI